MKAGLKIGDFELTWLNGGTFELDGGAMFGVVPKVLWQKKYPPSEDNYIPLTAWPILVKTPQALVADRIGHRKQAHGQAEEDLPGQGGLVGRRGAQSAWDQT